jgi:hypothetical protein
MRVIRATGRVDSNGAGDRVDAFTEQRCGRTENRSPERDGRSALEVTLVAGAHPVGAPVFEIF